jgi:hypothetical protein
MMWILSESVLLQYISPVVNLALAGYVIATVT